MMMMMIDLFVIISNNEEEHTVRPGVVLARATEHGVELHMSNINQSVYGEEKSINTPGCPLHEDHSKKRALHTRRWHWWGYCAYRGARELPS